MNAPPDSLLLIGPTVPGLRRYARTLLRDPADADDLVQDCLERAIGRWHQRRPGCDTRAWLFAILHNLAMDRLRQAARRGPHVRVEQAGPAAMARAPDQEQALHHREVLAALDGLPDDQRAVMLLVAVEDLSYAQAAEALGVPIGTVMSRLSRARARLREAFESRQAPGRSHLRRVK